MAMRSLGHVLGKLEDRYTLHEQKQFQKLLLAWTDVVGAIVAAQTRPTGMHHGVLRVATSSAAWSQNLVFERQRILEKLNLLVSLSLVDIRFSTAQWQQSKVASNTALTTREIEQVWQEHPSLLTATPVTSPLQPPAITPEQSYQRWAARVRSRMQGLPICPQCKCPTPVKELERWTICAHCAVKQW